mgnify:CR=1 FL=1
MWDRDRTREEARPLRKVASGGELSRAMLAIKAVSGEDFHAPLPEDNPYLADGAFPLGEMTKAGLEKLAQGEFGGEKLYEVWADNTANAEAARLFRLNGGEERDHGNRLLEAAALLPA